tara:strand:- start:23 stop:778 length:756 start_codon:yes stop_codon:yes gene_type:complete
MKIVVTGASGFIGHHLSNSLLSDGHEVRRWDKSLDRDIKDFKLDFDDEYVIHLAAIADVRRSIQYPEEYWLNNVEYTKRIQDECHDKNIPLIYASSSCAKKWWLSPYGTSKKVTEATAHRGQIGLRFTTVYGDGARSSMFMEKMRNGSISYTTNHIRDFIHVSDVVSAIRLLMEKTTSRTFTDYGGVYDVGTGEGVVVSELAQIGGYTKLLKHKGAECEANENIADNSRLRDMGWKPKIKAHEWVSNGYKC